MSATFKALILSTCLYTPAIAWADEHDADRYPESLPAALEPADGAKLAFVSPAEGVQIYDCKSTTAGVTWVFRAPEADLYASGAGTVGTHYAGPVWEWNSGGWIKGAVAARVNSSTAGAIPWLRLNVVDHDGPGVLSKVTTILRLDTVGGVAPSSGCDAASVGVEARVYYTAIYYFYRE